MRKQVRERMAKAEKQVAGRPEKPIDWELVDKFIESGCNATQIAAHFKMHLQTFLDRVMQKYYMTFTELAAQVAPAGEAHLLLKQHQKALKDNVQMLIWLGKIRLGQREPEPEKKAPPNDALLDNLITQAKAPENIVQVENSDDGTQQETTDELPTS